MKTHSAGEFSAIQLSPAPAGYLVAFVKARIQQDISDRGRPEEQEGAGVRGNRYLALDRCAASLRSHRGHQARLAGIAESDAEQFLKDLAKSGKLPVEQAQDYVEIRGYVEPG